MTHRKAPPSPQTGEGLVILPSTPGIRADCEFCVQSARNSGRCLGKLKVRGECPHFHDMRQLPMFV